VSVVVSRDSKDMDAVCESDAFLATVFLQACRVTSTQRNATPRSQCSHFLQKMLRGRATQLRMFTGKERRCVSRGVAITYCALFFL
jgi:hypothetical protein